MALLTVFASVQPVMKVLRKGAVELLRDNSYYRTRRVRNAWLVTEAALVFIIGWLLADPMLLNGVRRHAVPAGWDPDRVVCVPVSSLSASAAAYSPETSEDGVLLEDFRRIGRVLAALEGVEALTPTSPFIPGNNSETRMTVYADTSVKIQAACFLKELGSDFMDVFGFRVLAPEGGVRPADEGTGTVIISEDLAEALFPGSDPVGQTLYLANNSSPAAPRTVAGVIQRQKVRTMTDNPRPVVIVNMASYPVGYIRSGQCFWVLRLSQDTDMRQFIEQINYGTASRTSFGNLRVGLSYPVTKVMDSYGGRELETILLSYLLLNLILGAFSHYALQTRRRADEFGVRTAMGSTPGRLRRDVVAAGLGQYRTVCGAEYHPLPRTGRSIYRSGQYACVAREFPCSLAGADFAFPVRADGDIGCGCGNICCKCPGGARLRMESLPDPPVRNFKRRMIMKLPVYLRQSWQIMLKDRQYSLIYIIGAVDGRGHCVSDVGDYDGGRCISGKAQGPYSGAGPCCL